MTADAGLSDRIDTLPCDLCDPAFHLTEQYGAVVMIHTIREWSAEQVTRFFTLIHDALVPGGSVFINMAVEQEESDFRRRDDEVGIDRLDRPERPEAEELDG